METNNYMILCPRCDSKNICEQEKDGCLYCKDCGHTWEDLGEVYAYC